MAWIALFSFLFGAAIFAETARRYAWPKQVASVGTLLAGLGLMGLALWIDANDPHRTASPVSAQTTAR